MRGAITLSALIIREWGLFEYEPVWRAMQSFTQQRNSKTTDELWVVEHPPVFTQGQAGKAEHILDPGTIPIVQSDRGGQVTYHGPGQLVVYCLIDLKHKQLGVRGLVCALEKAVIAFLNDYHILSHGKPDAPGVYTETGAKICSLGLRVKRGCSYHGLALNINMDLSPFQRINPCGFEQLTVTQSLDLGGPTSIEAAKNALLPHLNAILGYNCLTFTNDRQVWSGDKQTTLER